MKISISIILVILLFDCQAQNLSKEESFWTLVDKYHLIYTSNDIFIPLKPQPESIDVGENLRYTTIYFLESKDRTACIGFRIFGLNIPKLENFPDVNMDYLRQINQMDNFQRNMKVAPNKIKFYPKKETSQLNAQFAGEYRFGLKEPFLGKYKHCVLRFFQTDDHAQVFIFYLFKLNDKNVINNTMDQTFDMLKFREQ